MSELPTRQARREPDADVLSLLADDEVVTALAAGRVVDGDELATLLAQFRAELDDAATATDLSVAPVRLADGPRSLDRVRTRALQPLGTLVPIGGGAGPCSPESRAYKDLSAYDVEAEEPTGADHPDRSHGAYP